MPVGFNKTQLEVMSYDDIVLATRFVVKQIANITKRPAPPDETIDAEIKRGVPKVFPTLYLITRYFDKRFELETEFNLSKRDKLLKLKSADEIRAELEAYDRQRQVDEQFIAELEANQQKEQEEIEAAPDVPIPENITEEEKIARIADKLIGRVVIERLLFDAVKLTSQGVLSDKSLITIEGYDKTLDVYETKIKPALLDLNKLLSKQYLGPKGSQYRKPFVEAYIKYFVLSFLAKKLKAGILPGDIMTKYNDDKKSFLTVFKVNEDVLPIIKALHSRIKEDKFYVEFIKRIKKLNK